MESSLCVDALAATKILHSYLSSSHQFHTRFRPSSQMCHDHCVHAQCQGRNLSSRELHPSCPQISGTCKTHTLDVDDARSCFTSGMSEGTSQYNLLATLPVQFLRARGGTSPIRHRVIVSAFSSFILFDAPLRHGSFQSSAALL